MSEILAVQLTAIATVVLAVFAIVTAVLAGLAFRKQAREVSDQAEMLDLQRRQLQDQREASAKQAGVLELQAAELRESLEDRRREAGERRREQASFVFLTENLGGGTAAFLATVTVVNESSQPIYDADLVWNPIPTLRDAPNPEFIGVILPGVRVTSTTRMYPPDTIIESNSAVLQFTDAAGIRWVREPDGYLGGRE